MEFGVIDETDDSMHYLGPRGTKKKKERRTGNDRELLPAC